MNPHTSPPPYSQTDPSSALPPVQRYIKADGKIGVITSRGLCCGWSTRVKSSLPYDLANRGRNRRMEEVAIFDKDVVAAVLDEGTPRARAIAEAKMGCGFNGFLIGMRWVDTGDDFEVEQGPDLEWIRLKSLVNFWRA